MARGTKSVVQIFALLLFVFAVSVKHVYCESSGNTIFQDGMRTISSAIQDFVNSVRRGLVELAAGLMLTDSSSSVRNSVSQTAGSGNPVLLRSSSEPTVPVNNTVIGTLRTPTITNSIQDRSGNAASPDLLQQLVSQVLQNSGNSAGSGTKQDKSAASNVDLGSMMLSLLGNTVRATGTGANNGRSGAASGDQSSG